MNQSLLYLRSFLLGIGGALLCAQGIVSPVMTHPAVAASLIQTFAVTNGPFSHPLNTNDQYSSWQWAYSNDGTFERTVEINYLTLTEESEKNHSLAQQPEGTGPALKAYLNIESKPEVDINLSPAWDAYDATSYKRDVIVALIDSGVDITHPDLMESIWVNEKEIPNDGIDNDNNGYIDDVYGWNFIDNTPIIHDSTASSEENHGTHGAGTIAASRGNNIGIAGIADSSHVKIMVLKTVSGTKGIGSYQSIVQAIQYASQNGASICNLSLGTYTDQKEMQDVIRQSNMLFVVACGNGDSSYHLGYSIEDSPVFPASYPEDNIISVASINFDGSLSNGSNYGAISVDIAAPGESILSTLPNGKYGMMSGTSMAAPMVTGLAAMLYTAHPDWSLADIKAAILETVTPLESLQGKTLTGGIPNAYRAMLWQKESSQSESETQTE